MQAAQSHTKPIDISQLITGHFIALQREEIQLHPPEHRHKLPYQETLTSRQYNSTHSEETPQWIKLHKLPEYRKATQTQQYKQDEKADKYPADKGTE